MAVHVRPASLPDGVAVLTLLEDVGYYPEPICFAQTFRKTINDPHFLVRVAEEGGRIIGVATLSLRYQLGIGGLLACLDELAIVPGSAEERPPAAAPGHRGSRPRPRGGPGDQEGEPEHAAAPLRSAAGEGAGRNARVPGASEGVDARVESDG